MKRKMENQQTPKEEKPVQINFVQQLPKEEPVKPILKVEDPKPAIEEDENVIDVSMNAQTFTEEPQKKPTRNNVTVIDRLFPF